MSKKICLIDGSGYIFRAFYGIPPMSTPDGLPVNAVYGFTNMFLKLTQKIDCDYSLVLFDAKRKNFRNEIYKEYKANRLDTPEDLKPQFGIIREAVEALSLNQLEMEGYEADDLIATLVKQSLKKGLEVVVVSADKDLMQLIKEGVTYYDPMKDKFCTSDDVVEKFGVLPDKVIDVQALAGDTSDNIPGVPGIGLKTAALLVNEFGSLEQVLARAHEIPQNKRREVILANIEQANISKQLVTLKDDIDIDDDFKKYSCKNPNQEKVSNFIEKYGFRSLKSRLEKWVSERQGFEAAEVIKSYELIQDESRLNFWAEKIKKAGIFAFDTETTGINPQFDEIVGFSLCVKEGEACYVPLKHGKKSDNFDLFANVETPKQLSFEIIKKHLLPIFEAKSILKIGHNIKFDMHFMSQVLGQDSKVFPIEDTCVLSYDLDSSEHGHGLDELAEIFLQYKTIKYEEVCGIGKNKISFNEVELDKALDYAAEDADITMRLYNIFKPRLIAEKKVAIYEVFDRPLISVLKDVEQNGIKVDLSTLKALSQDFDKKLQELEKEVYELAGISFNIGSPKQIGEVLSKHLGLNITSTSADILDGLAEEGHKLPEKILEWRGFAKLKSTYTDSLLGLIDKEDRVHTTFNQTGTNTGRLASSNPNLQNIPIRSEYGKKIRACFCARAGHKIIAVDYSQVELRLLASVADVKALKQAFLDGVDVHTLTASQVFNIPYEEVDKNTRSNAKAINFGIVYGMSQYGLARQLGISNQEAKDYIDAYFAKMPEIKTYMESTIEFARKNGFVLTPEGRKITIYGINDQNKRVTNNAERACINAPIQGGASDIIKQAMTAVAHKLQSGGFKTKMLLQVHDELVFESPIEELESVSKIIQATMEEVSKFVVPMKAEVGIGDNWAEAH